MDLSAVCNQLPECFFPCSEVNLLLYHREMSLCIGPTLDNTVESASIFTGLVVSVYYNVSLVTATLAGCIPAALSSTLDDQFVRGKMHAARQFVEFSYAAIYREPTQGWFTLASAFLISLYFLWHFLGDPARGLRRLRLPALMTGTAPESGEGLA